MAMGTFNEDGLTRLRDVLQRHVETGSSTGLTWLVSRHGEVHAGSLGALTTAGTNYVQRDSIFRISSMTKPVVAVGAMVLVEECRLRLDDPIDDLLPELAGRRVLSRPDGPVDETVDAIRPITLRDLLTFRLGLGMDFGDFGPHPIHVAMAEAGVAEGPPSPAAYPAPDEWMRRLGTLPLNYQPGTRWLYNTGAEVLGVLIARAAGQQLEVFLRDQVLGPLGMNDTAFSVPADSAARFGDCYGVDPETGVRFVYDAADGQWSTPPAFPSGGAGLVSTLDDFHAFAQMLAAGGTHRRQRILSRASVEAMTVNHLTADQLAASAPAGPAGGLGWGFGMGVQVARIGPTRAVGSYGWDGGLGTSWATDPDKGLIGVLLTTDMWSSPVPPPVCQDFWTCAYAALED
jgi:CubicO group peptidase (beta-lactamase class C family)